MDIRKEIKIILTEKEITQRELAKAHNMTPEGLNKKISKGSFKVEEFDSWLNELGYKLIVVKDDKRVDE